MHGVITLRDVVANLGVVLREFGAGCVVRCVVASLRRRRTTFLEIALSPKRP
ncbi:hypothetical protein [Corallococcus macrosporus]|uniref:Uncharacterized protein n=1 Tax=Myxococcus fulvus (strain ATCC BAA-855 / HW-1) TaxID=483219 RepID=F8CHN6_MYXFH|nr:hypothetical protein [Corallococcus macrosporus]AEI67537.1 hypothetical protein LILAB_28250 [Corallococcus macrosporus]